MTSYRHSVKLKHFLAITAVVAAIYGIVLYIGLYFIHLGDDR